jgi:NAD(P)H:quinone oxidoreductase type IV
MPETPKVTVVYYSSTGTAFELAKEIAAGAEKAGAEVRLRRVAELAPEAVIASRPAWAAHVAATLDVPVATADDVVWADGVVMGSPTRFGNIASQLKQFLDTLGPQWAQGLLADKVYSGFTTTDTEHGGQESTILALYTTFHHFGGIVVAPGYTDSVKFDDGNPYGSSHVGRRGEVAVTDTARAAARYQGERVARIAAALADNVNQDASE